MATFQFKSYDLTVDIAGNPFTFRCDAEMGDKMVGFQKEASKLATQLGNGEKTTEDAISFCSNVIDNVLGEGATDKIFTGRSKSITDFTDLIFFLANEIKSFTSAHKAEGKSNRRSKG